MGLFERTKHLEKLAREIADQNLRQLGSKDAPIDKETTRRQVLELEALLREYRLHLEEVEAHRDLEVSRETAAGEKAAQWVENAALAREKKRDELAEQAGQRAAVYERERVSARAEADHHQSTIARLRSEIEKLERRIDVLRALRKGETPAQPGPVPTTRRTSGTTTRINARPRDPLEEAFDELREDRSS
jgi:hypothetical protein